MAETVPGGTEGAARPAADARRANVPVLDLVRQYGDKREHALEMLQLADRESLAHQLTQEADALFVRIAELLPQQPVQARDISGLPMWQHDCGWSIGREREPHPLSHQGCHPGPWRPPSAGGAPTPESTAPGPVDHWYRCDDPDEHPQHGVVGKLGRVRCTGLPQGTPAPERTCPGCGQSIHRGLSCVDAVNADPDVLAQVIAAPAPEGDREAYWQRRFHEEAARGDEAGQQILTLHRERNEARDLIAQVMEALGVDRPEDVMSAVNQLAEANAFNHQLAEQWRSQRDEARENAARLNEVVDDLRAEVAKLRDKLDLARRGRDEARDEIERQATGFLAAVNKLTMERDFARRERDEALTERDEASAEVERLEAGVLEEIDNRDENHEWADRLANAIAEHLGVDIGEHSNMNLPWRAALIALTDAVSPTPADPLVLHLQEVPEGAVALVSMSTGARWVRADRVWRHEQGGVDGAVRNLGEILWIEHLGQGGLTVEMAPPAESAAPCTCPCHKD